MLADDASTFAVFLVDLLCGQLGVSDWGFVLVPHLHVFLEHLPGGEVITAHT